MFKNSITETYTRQKQTMLSFYRKDITETLRKKH